MLLRAITLAGGIAGATGMSQFPEYSQQYVQRLGGAVDELNRFVAEFDGDAAEVGLSRAAALDDLAQGGAMGQKRAETMGATLSRYERLNADLTTLETAGPFTQAYLTARSHDREIAAKAWAAFKPALPITFEGAVFAGIGLIAGITATGAILALLRGLFGRRKSPMAAPSA